MDRRLSLLVSGFSKLLKSNSANGESQKDALLILLCSAFLFEGKLSFCYDTLFCKVVVFIYSCSAGRSR